MSSASLSTIRTPSSWRGGGVHRSAPPREVGRGGGGRPPRMDSSPSSRKRRAAAASAGVGFPTPPPSTPGGIQSIGSAAGSVGGISEQSSTGQLRPSHSFTGGMNIFGGGFQVDEDDLDNFAQYVSEDEEDDDGDDGDDYDEEQGDHPARARIVSFGSDNENSEVKEGGMRRLFRSFDKRKRNKQKQKRKDNYLGIAPPQALPQPQQQQTLNQLHHLSSTPAVISPHHYQPPLNQYFPPPKPTAAAAATVPFGTKRPQSTLEPPSVEFKNTEILCKTSQAPRNKSVQDYRTYNEARSTLPKIGSFDLDIDTIPASPRIAPVSPFEQDDEVPEPNIHLEEERLVRRNPSMKSYSSSSTNTASTNIWGDVDAFTAMVPYASGGVELVDNASSVGATSAIMPVSSRSLSRQDSWDRRLERTDIYDRHYVPSRLELEELQELEDYLGIFSAKTKHRFSELWRQLVPPLDVARQKVARQNTLQRTHSTSSVSTLSTTTNHHPKTQKNNSSMYSIVLKRGPIQFEEYHDFQCELILLTRGFVVARPNFQYIPRFQAGDLWTSVVQVQPTNPLSITLSCTSRSTSTHLTLTQLKQQQQYGCYTYEISCASPDEQASWLEALRRVVVQSHDTAGTNEKEMGGLGWQYRVVYVPFFTEAVTGNPIQKDKILAGSTGNLDLNALDTYNSYAPLHYATRANHVRVMSFLLEAGADVHVGDGYGRTPMYYAELHQLPEATIQLLEDNGAQRTKKPISAGAAQEFWHKRNCRRKLFMAVMFLFLLLCAAGALLWKFGALEPLGIGGTQSGHNDDLETPTVSPDIESVDSSAAATERTPQPSIRQTKEPTASPVVMMKFPPLVSRDIETPKPTPTGTVTYIKTAPPVPATGAPSTSPSTAPTPTYYNSALFQLLESASFDAGEALRKPGSPQNRAFNWLLGNANLDSYTNSKKIQRYALATFYYSTNGDNWADNLWWLSDEDECMWFNKEVQTGYQACQISTSGNAQKLLTSLDLSFNNVHGVLPPELGLLSGLLRVDLDGGPSGFLTGPIPTELGYLDLLESFSARGNQLTGTLPAELGKWRLVRGIDLSYNKLTGTLPPSFGSMTWLTELTLEMNDFSGTLPALQLGHLRNLFKLSLGGNQMGGPIPSEIGFLTKLRYLYLELNQFSSLPTEVGLLENLNAFSIFENVLEGAIPSELGRLTKLGTLILRSNAFNSSIPSEMGLMGQLQNTLDLSFNGLSGPVPSELGQLTKLRSLYLQSNILSGAIPNEVSQLNRLNALRVESNSLVGRVPTTLCSVFNRTFCNFYADCSEVACPCCTYCCSDKGGCRCQHAGTARAYLC